MLGKDRPCNAIEYTDPAPGDENAHRVPHHLCQFCPGVIVTGSQNLGETQAPPMNMTGWIRGKN